MASYSIFISRILEISNIIVVKNRLLLYGPLTFFPSIAYGLYISGKLTKFQENLDKKYTDLYI